MMLQQSQRRIPEESSGNNNLQRQRGHHDDTENIIEQVDQCNLHGKDFLLAQNFTIIHIES